jgi:uncharacterized protein YggE
MFKKLLAVTSLLLSSSFNYAYAEPTSPHLSVTGYAEQLVQPDQVVLNVAISHSDKNINKAKDEVDSVIARVIKVANTFNVSKNNIDASQLNIYRQHEYNQVTQKQEFSTFQVTRNVEIKLTDVNKYALFLQELVEAGINEIGYTQFSYSKAGELQDKLKELAIKDAKFEAKELASAFDAKLDRVYSVNFAQAPSVTTSYGRQSMIESGRAHKQAYNVSDIVISAEVFVTYLIKQ